jgi:hypothetical protein
MLFWRKTIMFSPINIISRGWEFLKRIGSKVKNTMLPKPMSGPALTRALMVSLVVMFTFTTMSIISHGQATAQPNNAVVIHPPDGLCSMLDGNGNSGFISTTNTHITQTQSQNGNTMLRCQVKKIVPNSTGSAVEYDFDSTGLLCGIALPLGGFVVTDDWHESVSSGGNNNLANATLVCHYNANQ